MSEFLRETPVEMRMPNKKLKAGAQVGAPSHVGSIQLERFIGQGGTAEIYLGHDTAKPETQPIVVKVAKPKRELHGASTKDPLRNEIIVNNILAGQPHIVRYLDHGRAKEGKEVRRYIVMEHADGGSIDAEIKARGRLEVDRTVSVIEQAASGLSVVHREKLVHRDVKPSNLLRVGEEVKLSDFGITAEASGDIVTMTLDEGEVMLLPDATNVAIGTPLYMAPEQVRSLLKSSKAQVGPSTDVLGLGLAAHEMLTGSPLRDRASTSHEHLRTLLDPEQYDAQVAAAVRRLELLGFQSLVGAITKAVDKEEGNRHESVGAFARDLRDRASEMHASRNQPARKIFIAGSNGTNIAA